MNAAIAFEDFGTERRQSCAAPACAARRGGHHEFGERLVHAVEQEPRALVRPISRAAAEIEPVFRMLSSSFALPGPIRAPDSKTMLTLTLAMLALCMREGVKSRLFSRRRPERSAPSCAYHLPAMSLSGFAISPHTK